MNKRMKKIGLVLAGGGGRGAYHIGVWEALRDTKLDQYVSAISGTSVGGLNAALFLQGDIDRAKRIWENISAEKILTPRHDFEKFRKHFRYKPEKHHDLYLYIREGLIDIIHNNLDMSVFDTSSKNCYMACRQTGSKDDIDSYEQMFTYPNGMKECKKYVDGKAVYFNMRGHSYEDREKILLATSAMPFIFPKEKIGGQYYMDGGSVDNLPVEPLYRIEKCEIIVVVHLTTNSGLVDHGIFPGSKILEIRPKQDQGGLFAGILDFDAESAKRRMRQGYADTIEMFRNIEEEIEREIKMKNTWRGAVEREEEFQEKFQKKQTEIEKMMSEINNRGNLI